MLSVTYNLTAAFHSVAVASNIHSCFGNSTIINTFSITIYLNYFYFITLIKKFVFRISVMKGESSRECPAAFIASNIGGRVIAYLYRSFHFPQFQVKQNTPYCVAIRVCQHGNTKKGCHKVLKDTQ